MQTVVITGQGAIALATYRNIKSNKDFKSLTEKLAAAKKTLRKLIGDYEPGKVLVDSDNNIVAQYNVKSSSTLIFDEDQFATDHPDLYDQYLTLVKPEVHEVKFQE